MSKWALVADMTTGLANALESYNKGQMDEVDKHLGIIDRMVTAQKMGYDLELAKLKYQNQGMDPLDQVKLLQEQLKLKQSQELETANNQVIESLVASGKPREEAIRIVKAAQDVTASMTATERIGEVGAKEGTPGAYTAPVEAQTQKAVVETETAKQEQIQGLPTIGTQAKVAEAQGTIQTEPQMSLAELDEQQSQAKIAGIHAQTEKALRDSQMRLNAAMAKAAGDQLAYDAIDNYLKVSKQEVDMNQDLMELENATRAGKGAAQSVLFARKHKEFANLVGNPELMVISARKAAANRGNLSEAAIQDVKQNYPKYFTNLPKAKYNVPFASWDQAWKSGINKQEINKNINTLSDVYDVEVSFNAPEAGGVFGVYQREEELPNGTRRWVGTTTQSRIQSQTQTQQKPAPKQEVKSLEGKPAQETKPAPKKEILNNNQQTEAEFQRRADEIKRRKNAE